MRSKLIVTAILAAALGAYIYFVETPKDLAKQLSEAPFAKVQRGAFQRIDISTVSGESFYLENLTPKFGKNESEAEQLDGSKWQLSGIKGAALEQATLNGLINGLIALKIDGAIEEEELEKDLALYGLDKTNLKLKVKAQDKEKTLSFGKKNDFIARQYIQFAGDPKIYLVPELLYTLANKKASDFRDKSPFDLPEFTMKSISLERESGELKLEKENYEWLIKKPTVHQTDKESINGLIRGLRLIQAEQFIDPDTTTGRLNIEALALDKPILKVIVISEDLPNNIYIFSKKKNDSGAEEIYGKEEGIEIAYKLSSLALEPLLKPIEALRKRKFLSYESESFSEIVLSSPENQRFITLKRKSPGKDLPHKWFYTHSDQKEEKEADAPFVKEYVGKLTAVEAIGFPKLEAASSDNQINSGIFSFDKPSFSIEMAFIDPHSGDFAKITAKRRLLIGAQSKSDDLYLNAKDNLGWYAIVEEETIKDHSTLSQEEKKEVVNVKGEPFIISNIALEKLKLKPDTILPASAASKEASSIEEAAAAPPLSR